MGKERETVQNQGKKSKQKQRASLGQRTKREWIIRGEEKTGENWES